jgi:hypothetical protein
LNSELLTYFREHFDITAFGLSSSLFGAITGSFSSSSPSDTTLAKINVSGSTGTIPIATSSFLSVLRRTIAFEVLEQLKGENGKFNSTDNFDSHFWVDRCSTRTVTLA